MLNWFRKDKKQSAEAIGSWPFDQTPNTAAITLKAIVFDRKPILHVTHDEDDHSWQFLSLDQADTDDAAVVAMREIVSLDPSVKEVADMPPGWHAWRETASSPWQRALQAGG